MKYDIIFEYEAIDNLTCKDVKKRHSLIETWNDLELEELKSELINYLDVPLDGNRNPVSPTMDYLKKHMPGIDPDTEQDFFKEMFDNYTASYEGYSKIMDEVLDSTYDKLIAVGVKRFNVMVKVIVHA